MIDMNRNKELFLDLISKNNRPTQKLIEFLNSSDFFEAPASTKYHSCYPGGLCEHSLQVGSIMVSLAEAYLPGRYNIDDLYFIGLVHDISKANFYEVRFQNKKIYRETGKLHDNQGAYDWESIKSYGVKENRFLGGTHSENSVLILSDLVELSHEEKVAILNHHAGMDEKGVGIDLTAIYNKYPLASLLHIADMLATYIGENDAI